ncbi:MAG TPA: thioredoxin-disulfide reductase [Cyanobacteria bacterium UBA8530]|nr:thioredoxin-disulfide reductase [Cyanobacteria bacterium UBA8530]
MSEKHRFPRGRVKLNIENKQYDVIVIGGGPAGLSAALYASRANLSTLLVDKGVTGGQVATTFWIENYPGFPDGVGGPELIASMEAQAKRFGTEIAVIHEVLDLDANQSPLRLSTTEGNFLAKTLIIASGAEPGVGKGKLNIPGEDTLRGRGVSYCATCDGAFFRDLDVAVIGGGDSAIEEAIFLTKFAKSVTVVHRRQELRAAKVLQERAFNNEKIKFKLGRVPVEIKGETKVEGLVVEDVNSKASETLDVKGVFIFVGVQPNSGFLKDNLDLDAQGYILTDERMRTSIPGVFAAGDIRQKQLRQVVTAVSDGAIAAVEAERFIEGLN